MVNSLTFWLKQKCPGFDLLFEPAMRNFCEAHEFGKRFDLFNWYFLCRICYVEKNRQSPTSFFKIAVLIIRAHQFIGQSAVVFLSSCTAKSLRILSHICGTRKVSAEKILGKSNLKRRNFLASIVIIDPQYKCKSNVVTHSSGVTEKSMSLSPL